MALNAMLPRMHLRTRLLPQAVNHLMTTLVRAALATRLRSPAPVRRRHPLTPHGPPATRAPRQHTNERRMFASSPVSAVLQAESAAGSAAAARSIDASVVAGGAGALPLKIAALVDAISSLNLIEAMQVRAPRRAAPAPRRDAPAITKNSPAPPTPAERRAEEEAEP